MSQVDSWYQTALAEISLAKEELNLRTGVSVKAVPGMTFRTDLEADGFPLLALRKMPMAFCAEQVWFLSGSNNVKWLSKHTKIWDSFAEEDGTVTSAYGHRWRNGIADMVPSIDDKRGFRLAKIDQLETVLLKLRKDQSDRHGVVMMWQPLDLVVSQKNVPCPYTFTLMIIDGRLHLHLVVRSNDMVLGFPTDAAGFALLQHVLAQELGVRPGMYTHSISNAHVYANHDWAVELMMKRSVMPGKCVVSLPPKSYDRARLGDDSLVDELRKSIKGYEPMPAITGMKIAI